MTAALALAVDPAPDEPVLSARGRMWRHPDTASPQVPAGVDPLAAAIAFRRGASDLGAFFSPSLQAYMPDPSSLDGMPEAVTKLCDAVCRGASFGIVGDYDVDGATSVAMLLRWLSGMGLRASYYVPNRVKEGYGVSVTAVDTMRQSGVDLMVVADSGTAAIEPLAHAKAVGLDVLVVDHHEPGPQLPDALVVNPKLRREGREHDHLCTAGLMFLLLVGANRELSNRGFFVSKEKPDLRRLLGLAALGTVADVVPLVGLNRAYVAVGLRYMEDLAGIRALSDATGQAEYSVWSLGFVFGPCINAAGRIDDTRLGALLLSDDDPSSAGVTARRLAAINRERQEIQRGMVADCLAKAEAGRQREKSVVVLYDEGWHPGVVGLAAARLREAFDLPSIVIGQGGKASCRSIEGFDMGEAIIAAKEAGILVAGGGHRMAAGLTVEPSRVDELTSFVRLRAAGVRRPPLQIDLSLEPGAIGPQLLAGLEQMAPFGLGNPRPRIAVVGGTLRRVALIKETHVKFALEGPQGTTEAIMFGGAETVLGRFLRSSEGRRIDVLGTAKSDWYGGVERAVLHPEDARSA